MNDHQEIETLAALRDAIVGLEGVEAFGLGDNEDVHIYGQIPQATQEKIRRLVTAISYRLSVEFHSRDHWS